MANRLFFLMAAFWALSLRLGAVLYILFCSAWVEAKSPNANTDTYTYPIPESLIDTRQHYPIELLEFCAAKSDGQWQVKPGELHMQQGRALKQLQRREGIDITWTAASKHIGSELQSIPVPIDRGLLGWRLLLISESHQDQFKKITELSQLQQLTAGQGHDWIDTDILRFNRFKVSGSTSYEGLFDMLRLDHIDYFPRSISEAFEEITARPEKRLTYANNLVIHYPLALYFFVNSQDKLLTERLTQCLTTATATGDLKKMFYRRYGKEIEKADLKNKTVFKLINPFLPSDTPLEKSDLWFTPEELAP